MNTAPDSLKPPLSPHVLRRMALQMARNVPTEGLGAHLRQRGGQSMEFREFSHYLPGDDIRRVDWKTSMRVGGMDDLLMRRFEAEQRRTLCILIDGRAAMHLPEALPKIQAAVWAMLCLVEISISAGDQVILGTLFHARDTRPVKVSGAPARRAAQALARDLLAPPDWRETAVMRSGKLRAMIPPTSSALILTDALFEDADGRVAALMRDVQKGYRQVIVGALDAWPAERHLLASGPLKLGALEGRSFGDTVLDAPQSALDTAEAAINAHLARQRRRWSRGALVWPRRALRWPEQPADPLAWFRSELITAGFLSPLLSRA